MQRPEKVADAIRLDEAGVSFGFYKNYKLQSAYQPIYSQTGFATLELLGYEATLNVSMNGEIISVSELKKNVDPEDGLFLQTMAMALHIRNYKYCGSRNKKLFLNIDASVFGDAETIEREFFYTFSQLGRHGLCKDLLVFEIQNSFVKGSFVLARLCEIMRGNGFVFALDDFGTGHSTIERYILSRPDMVKFCNNLFVNPSNLRKFENLLASMINGFRSNGAQVFLNGIHTEEALNVATEMDANLFQGDYFSEAKLLPFEVPEEVTLERNKAVRHLHAV